MAWSGANFSPRAGWIYSPVELGGYRSIRFNKNKNKKLGSNGLVILYACCTKQTRNWHMECEFQVPNHLSWILQTSTRAWMPKLPNFLNGAFVRLEDSVILSQENYPNVPCISLFCCFVRDFPHGKKMNWLSLIVRILIFEKRIEKSKIPLPHENRKCGARNHHCISKFFAVITFLMNSTCPESHPFQNKECMNESSQLI